MLHYTLLLSIVAAPGQDFIAPPEPPPPPAENRTIEERTSATSTTSSESKPLEVFCADLAQITYSCSSVAMTPDECKAKYRGAMSTCTKPFQHLLGCIADAGFMCEGENHRPVNSCDDELVVMQGCSTSTAAQLIPLSKGEEAQKENEEGEYEEEAPAKRKSIKGNIVHLGTRELVSRFDHISLRAGPRIISKDFYLTVAPSGALYTDSFAFSFNVPLNLLLYEGASLQTSFEDQKLDFGGFKIRAQDWDEISDFARVIRFITYGRKESPVYFTITNLRPSTLGHGQLVHNYQANLDVDRSMTGLVFDAYNKWAGFQFQMNDITYTNQIIGALAFVKPMGWSDNKILKTLSLGFEYAADFKAPRCIQISKDNADCVSGTGHHAGPDPYTGRNRDNTFVRTDPELGRPLVAFTDVQAFGFSGEIKFLKTESVDLKAYATWHQFAGAGNGLAGGMLSRLTLGDTWISGIRARTEYRSFTEGFSPAYWDTLYEISKYQTIQSKSIYQVAPTKYQSVFGDPENGFELQNTGRRNGYNMELSWGLFKNSRRYKKVAVGLGLTGSSGGDDTNFYAHIELPLFKYVQIFGSFIRLNTSSPGEAFSTDLKNVIALTAVRLQVLPFMFVNLNYARSFQNIRRPGAEFHLGNENIVDRFGKPSPFFTQDRIYEASHVVAIELELGLEFKE